MRKREKLEGSYFTGQKNILFVSSGCTLLDCALGGGYPLGRITNIVGDKSTAKTSLATEALINFIRTYPSGRAAYRESEAAFDNAYAASMGLPVDDVDFGDVDNPLTTVEDFARDFETFLDDQIKAKEPGIYILDSLDALSDETEMENDIGKGTFGAQKAKQLSVLFRKLARKCERSKVLLIIISQVRDNIGVMFGEKHKRSGGRALDFYASQIMFLSHVKTLKRTVNKIERPTGITIRAKIKKNKVGLPLREVEFDFDFGFGVNDLKASADWLTSIGRFEDQKAYFKSLDGLSDEQYQAERVRLATMVNSAWADVETSFLPTRRKYG